MMFMNKLKISVAFFLVAFVLSSSRRAGKFPNGKAEKESLLSTKCVIRKPRLSDRTSFFQVGNNPVPNDAFTCHLSSKNNSKECTLNVAKVLQRLKARQNLSTFYFRTKCVKPLRVVFHFPTNITKIDVISYLHIFGPCEVSAKDLAVWGRATDLRVLYLQNRATLREDENQTESELEGLFNVGSLFLIDLSNKGIPRMLTSFVWPRMAEVQFTKMALTSVPDALKTTMPYLQSLELSHNNLHEPPDFPWCNTSLKLPRNLSRTALGNEHYSQEATVDPRLYRRFLGIDFNPGLNVSNYEFPFGALDRISLRGNGLKLINPTIFSKTRKLQVVDLSRNKLPLVHGNIFRETGSLVTINLASNRLGSVTKETFLKLQKLQKVDISNNVIQTLPSGLFNSLKNLEEIDLRNNSLKNIQPNALPAGSNSLKRVYMQHNNLRYIPNCAFYARNLDVFDLSNNLVNYTSLLHALDGLDIAAFVFAHSESSSALDERQHKSLRTKKRLIIKENDIAKMDVTGFNQSRLEKFKSILKAFTLNIAGNPLTCDCKIRHLQLMILNWTQLAEEINADDFQSWKCHAPDDLRGRNALSVSQEKLKCKASYLKCPRQCQCYKRAYNLPILVECRKNLTELPDTLPSGLLELHLEYNQIEIVHFSEILENITSLYLSHNSLREINISYFLPSKLCEIFLDFNQLSFLPKDFQNLSLSKINLQNNFFECDCRNKWMKTWLQRIDSAVIGGAQSVPCSSGKNQGKPLISVNDNDFICPPDMIKDKSSQHAGVYVTIAYVFGGLSFMLLLFVILYRFRGEVKLLLYTRLDWHPFDRVDDSDPSKIYDAFVSYSSHDEHWVTNTLKEKLENEEPRYQLCLHQRDFLAGASIFKNIFDSVEASRRMIMVLSNSFLQSEWCMMEFRAAHQRVLKDRTNYLIIILYDDVDEDKLDKELKLYLRTNTYLSITNKWFWQQLRYALPQRSMEARQTQITPRVNEVNE